jgi:hypothetical protein
MKQSNNVIDFKSRKSASQGPNEARKAKLEAQAPVLDMTERRNEMLTQERRLVRRTILTEFIGAHIVVPERGLQKVAVYDVSEDGLAFDIELGLGAYSMGEEVSVRVYLNQQTYFPFIVKIANVRSVPEEGVVRHGGRFVKGTLNDVALHHFVKFIETVSASLKTDNGDVMVSGLRR